MSFIDPIIPNPDWGTQFPSVDPEEWEDDDEDWERDMILDTGTLIAIVIALGGSLTVMGLFWRENIRLMKEIRKLQVALRDERRK